MGLIIYTVLVSLGSIFVDRFRSKYKRVKANGFERLSIFELPMVFMTFSVDCVNRAKQNYNFKPYKEMANNILYIGVAVPYIDFRFTIK